MSRVLRQIADTFGSSIDATLNRLRMHGDPLADAVALRLDTPPHLNPLPELRFLARSEIGLYQELLDHANSVPAATDFAQVEHGRGVQLAFINARHLAWLFGALPQGWGNCPILRSDQCTAEFHQRLAFNRNVNHALVHPNSLQPGGDLHEVLLQRRLQLALERKLAKESGWNSIEYGEPFNQEYLLLMLLEYSVLTADNMARLGATLSAADQTAIAAFWRLAGYWLGLDLAIIPANRDAAIQLLHRIRWRHSQDTARRAKHAAALQGYLLEEGATNHSIGLVKSIISWCNQTDTPTGPLRSQPERGLQFLIVANRGATFAHYHLPGVGSLRQQINGRQLRLESPASQDTGLSSAHQIA